MKHAFQRLDLRRLLLPGALAALVAGCGQFGDLYLPREPAAEPPPKAPQTAPPQPRPETPEDS